jgi:uncharacterized protein (DUF302 family)
MKERIMKPFKTLAVAAVVSLTASTLMAERISVSSNANVDQSVGRLEAAVTAAGARVFTKVDFAKGANTQGETLRPTTIVIFGSPKIGSTTLQKGQTMALNLPLRVLFFEDATGQTWATYDDPVAIAPTHGIGADNPAILRMKGALEKFVSAATGQ